MPKNTRFLFLLVFAFALRLGAQSSPSSATAGLPYTPGLDISYLDQSVDPCTDFYMYACGGWIKENPIPADQASWGVTEKLQDENRVLLRRILENAANPAAPRNATEQKIGDYYASCIDEAKINADGAKPLQHDLERIAALRSKADIAGWLAYFHARDIYNQLNSSALFSFGSDQDFKDASQFIAEADQGGLGLPDRDYYLKTDAKSADLRKAYVTHVQRMFELLGDASSAAAANAETVMRIETALAKSSQTVVERRDPNNVYHKMTTTQLAALAPSFDWKSYFHGVGLGSLQSLNVTAPDFFRGMNAELKAESLSTWKTYLRWHLVHANARYLSQPFLDEHFQFFEKTLTGAKQLQPRWKRCVRFVDRDLGEALGQSYVARTFTPADKQRALSMVEAIERAMDRDLHELTWMSEPTRQQALLKLHAVRNKIGYPDHWRDYSALNIVRGDYIGNVERSIDFEFQRNLHKIGRPIDRGEWLISPSTVNAYYNPTMNDINFPAGILQPPLFDPKMDDAPNYGDTGGTMGHELTHGFDDEGRQFDAQGNLRDWWTAADAKQFEQRTECVAGQYAQYTVVDDIKINSKLTLGEDVADLGGLRLAYDAWKEITRDQKLGPIDGLSPEQRFFIGYAQSWCTNEREESLRLHAAIDPHSPPKYRTNGVVSDMPEFQRAFGCKVGAAMVREKACRVW
jgi:putative endopeptidase